MQACQFSEGFRCAEPRRLLIQAKSTSVVLQFAVPSVTGASRLADYIFPNGLILARITADISVSDLACLPLVLVLCIPDRVNHGRCWSIEEFTVGRDAIAKAFKRSVY